MRDKNGEPMRWAEIDDETLDEIIAAILDRAEIIGSNNEDAYTKIRYHVLAMQDIRSILSEVKLEGYVKCPYCQRKSQLAETEVINVLPEEAACRCVKCKKEFIGLLVKTREELQ
jgi:DNA-directed RNA polymerase subunit RPC12/RpoP